VADESLAERDPFPKTGIHFSGITPLRKRSEAGVAAGLPDPELVRCYAMQDDFAVHDRSRNGSCFSSGLRIERGEPFESRKPVRTIRASVRSLLGCMFRIAGNLARLRRRSRRFQTPV
jgi:hypothetical protein